MIVQTPKKRMLAGVLLCLMLFSVLLGGVPSLASEVDITLPSIDEADSILFYHIEGDETLCAKNETKLIAAGSTVKIMSGLLFCEELSMRTAELVTISEDMISESRGYSLDIIKVGRTFTVDELLYAALCGSYNNAFDVLACYLAGSIDDFVALMNARAAQLGAQSTTFTSPSGVDDTAFTTAEDIAKIALAAYHLPLYMQYTSKMRYSFVSSTKTIYNRNALIYSDLGQTYYNAKCQGMSAGETNTAGSCVITVASNGTESYLSIVMGGEVQNISASAKNDYGYIVTNRLIDWVYNAYSYIELLSPEDVICKIPISVSDMTSELEVKTHDSLSFYLPKNIDPNKDITYSIRLINTELEAPVADGTLVGYVAVIWNEKVLGTLPLYTAGSAERSTFISSLKAMRSMTESRVFRAGIIFFAISVTAWIATEAILLYRKHHKWDKYFSMKMNPSITTPQIKNEFKGD